MKRKGPDRLADVAEVVARALANAGIRAVLTGGACATILTDGAYQSADLDFILEGEVRRRDLDAALATVRIPAKVSAHSGRR